MHKINLVKITRNSILIDLSSTGQNYKNITLLTLSPYNTSANTLHGLLTQKQSILTKSLSLTNSYPY